MPSRSILGVDLGGTKTAVALFSGDELKCENIVVSPTHADRSFAHVRHDLLSRIQSMRQPDTVAIGLGVPGLIDRESRHIRTMPNIRGAEGQDLRGFIEEKTGLKTIIENDANCFAYAEALQGAGKNERIVVGITLGTGVGGGIVIDGKIFHGAHGSAGEIGHMLLAPGNPPYKTDNKRGEVEQFLSGTAMGKRCEEAMHPEEYLKDGVCTFMHPDLFREVAWLVTNLTHLIDPSVIVFGGSAGKSLKPHLPKIELELKNWLLPHALHSKLAIAELNDAAVRGAALLAW